MLDTNPSHVSTVVSVAFASTDVAVSRQVAEVEVERQVTVNGGHLSVTDMTRCSDGATVTH